MVKSNSRQGKHSEFEIFGNTQGIWKFKIEGKIKYVQKKLLRDVDGFNSDVFVFYYEKYTG